MHADIFFFIASVGFIVLCILLAIVLVYIISLVRMLHAAIAMLKTKAEGMEADAELLLEEVRESVIFRLLFGRTRKKRTRSSE